MGFNSEEILGVFSKVFIRLMMIVFNLWFFSSAHNFFLSHCMGNASGTNESIQLTERRTLSPGTVPSASFNVPSSSGVGESIRSNSVQPTINPPNPNEMNVKKSIQLEPQTSLLIKRTSDGFMSTTNNDEQTRRRSSLSTDVNTSTRKTVNPINSTTSTTINSSKDPSSISNSQINKSMVTFSSNGASNEKVVIIDTTAVSGERLH